MLEISRLVNLNSNTVVIIQMELYERLKFWRQLYKILKL